MSDTGHFSGVAIFFRARHASCGESRTNLRPEPGCPRWCAGLHYVQAELVSDSRPRTGSRGTVMANPAN